MREPKSSNRVRIGRSSEHGAGREPGLVSNLISSSSRLGANSFGEESAAGGCNRVENSPVCRRGGGGSSSSSSGGEIGERLGCVEGLLV